MTLLRPPSAPINKSTVSVLPSSKLNVQKETDDDVVVADDTDVAIDVVSSSKSLVPGC